MIDFSSDSFLVPETKILCNSFIFLNIFYIFASSSGIVMNRTTKQFFFIVFLLCSLAFQFLYVNAAEIPDGGAKR